MYKFPSGSSHTHNCFSGSAYLSFITVTAAVSISTHKMWYLNPIQNGTTNYTIQLYYTIVWVLMEILYSIFIGIIASKIASKIDGIGLQCRRDSNITNIIFCYIKI